MTFITSQPSPRAQKYGARLGAVLSGIDARNPLDEEVKAFLRTSLLRHKVIFLRDQHLDDLQHERLSRVFGEPIRHPTVPAPGGTEFIFDVKSSHGRSTDSWHTDVTFVPDYPKASLLRAIDIPAYGGGTVWANTASAYDDLPTPLKALADNAWAIHSNDYDTNFHKYDARKDEIADFRAAFISTVFRTEHPVVHVHPETGERNLLLGHFVTGLRGIPTRQAHRIVEILQDYVIAIDNTVTWKWQPGDIAIWDNRATQHYAPADFDEEGRHLRRITVAGEAPRSVDGRRSRAASEPRTVDREN